MSTAQDAVSSFSLWTDPEVARIFLTTVGTVTVAFLAYLTVRVQRLGVHARRTRNQVENNHFDPETGEPINMREEADERHQQNADQLQKIVETLAEVKDNQKALYVGLTDARSDVRGLRRDVGRLWDVSNNHTESIHEMELTQPRRGVNHDKPKTEDTAGN